MSVRPLVQPKYNKQKKGKKSQHIKMKKTIYKIINGDINGAKKNWLENVPAFKEEDKNALFYCGINVMKQ